MKNKKEIIKARQNEITLISKLLKEKQSLLINGKKGSGKTTVLKAVAKKLHRKVHEIDAMKISKKDIYSNNMFRYLSLKGKCKFLLNNFLFHFIKYFSAIIPIYLSIVVPVAFSSQAMKSFNTLSKYLISFAPLIAALIYLVFIKASTLLFRRQIILVSELNFIDTQKELIPFFWNLKKIYNSDIFVFESTDTIDEHTIMKFNLVSIEIGNGNDWFKPFSIFLEELKNLKNSPNIWEKIAAKDLYDSYENNIITIQELISQLSFRDIELLSHEIKIAFKFLKGEFNLFDYVLIFYMRINYPEIASFIKNNSRSLFKQKLILSSQIKSGEITPEIDELKKRIDGGVVNSRDKSILERRNWFNLFRKKRIVFHEEREHKFSIDSENFTENYFHTSTYGFLHSDLVSLFENNPIDFMTEIVSKSIEIRNFDFKVFTDSQIVDFLEGIDKVKNDQIANLYKKYNGFGVIDPMTVLTPIIFESRNGFEAKKRFFNELPRKWKFLFAASYLRTFSDYEKEEEMCRKIYDELQFGEDDIQNIANGFKWSNFYAKFRNTGEKWEVIPLKIFIKNLINIEMFNLVLIEFLSFNSTIHGDGKTDIFLFYQVNQDKLGEELTERVLEAICKYDKELNIYIIVNKKLISFREIQDFDPRTYEDVE